MGSLKLCCQRSRAPCRLFQKAPPSLVLKTRFKRCLSVPQAACARPRRLRRVLAARRRWCADRTAPLRCLRMARCSRAERAATDGWATETLTTCLRLESYRRCKVRCLWLAKPENWGIFRGLSLVLLCCNLHRLIQLITNIALALVS